VRRERRYGSFSCSIALPETAKRNEIDGAYGPLLGPVMRSSPHRDRGVIPMATSVRAPTFGA
jgi:hypothetical protein